MLRTKRRRRPEDLSYLDERRRPTRRNPALFGPGYSNLLGEFWVKFQLSFIGARFTDFIQITSIDGPFFNNGHNPDSVAEDYYLNHLQYGDPAHNARFIFGFTAVGSHATENGGYFQLARGATGTPDPTHIPWDTQPSSFSPDYTVLQGVLDNLYGAGNTVVSMRNLTPDPIVEPPTVGYGVSDHSWFVDFQGALAGGAVPLYAPDMVRTITSNLLSSRGGSPGDFVFAEDANGNVGNDDQNTIVQFGLLGIRKIANYTIHFNVNTVPTSVTISSMATADDVRAAFEANSMIGVGNVSVIEDSWRTHGNIFAYGRYDYLHQYCSFAGLSGFGAMTGTLTVEPAEAMSGLMDGHGSYDAVLNGYQGLYGQINGFSNYSCDLFDIQPGCNGLMNSGGGMYAYLNNDPSMVGSIDGVSSLVGTLLLPIVSLAGGFNGASNFSSALYVDNGLAGTIMSAGSMAAALSRNAGLTGSIDGTSALSATSRVDRALTGSLDGSSSLASSLQAIRRIIGSFSGTGSFDGGLSATRRLAGAIAGLSGLTGEMTPFIAVAGVISGVSVFNTSSLSVTRDLISSMDGAGNMNVFPGLDRAPLLVGSLDGASSLVGNLAWGQKLRGSFSGSSAMAATMTNDPHLIGSIDGHSSFLSAVYVDRLLVGAIGGVGGFQASVDIQTALSGQLGGVSQFSGLLNGGWGLRGSIDGSSSWADTTLAAGHRIELGGSIDGHSTVANNAMYVEKLLVGRMDGQGVLAGDAYVDWSLSGSIQSSGQFSASLGTILTQGPFVVDETEPYLAGQQESQLYSPAGAEASDFIPIDESEVVDDMQG